MNKRNSWLAVLFCGLSCANVYAWTVNDNISEVTLPALSGEWLQTPQKEGALEISPKEVQITNVDWFQESNQERGMSKAVSTNKELLAEAAYLERQQSMMTANKPVFEKSAASYNLEEQVFVDYHAALDLLKKGKMHLAEKMLLNNLMLIPGHFNSRAELVTLYLKNHRDSECEQLLVEGLRQDEDNSEFLRLMAIVLERKNEPEEALVMLSKMPLDKKNDKNVVALLGHLYQQTGRFSLAKQQYYRLLQIEPNNPVWILGTAIALESDGRRKEALESYKQIRSANAMDPKLLDFVQNRITALNG